METCSYGLHFITHLMDFQEAHGNIQTNVPSKAIRAWGDARSTSVNP